MTDDGVRIFFSYGDAIFVLIIFQSHGRILVLIFSFSKSKVAILVLIRMRVQN